MAKWKMVSRPKDQGGLFFFSFFLKSRGKTRFFRRKKEREEAYWPEELTWTSARPVLCAMTTSTEPSGRGRQYPLSACIGSPDTVFHVFCVYDITGCSHPPPPIRKPKKKL
jgi:hypothetical protein